MSNPEGWRPTRRCLVSGAASLLAPAALGAELPILRSDLKQFVQFEPCPVMVPLPLRDLLGRAATLGPPRHGALLVYVWATWCPSCPQQLTRLARDRMALARLGVEVATVSIDTRPAADVSAFLARHAAAGLPVFHDPGGSALVATRRDGTSSPFQRWSMPLTFAVDGTGAVRGYIAGAVDWLRPESQTFLKALSA